jgi:hypothetical protein
VADDGSDNLLVNEIRALGVTTITGKNRGVCWNKNRGLHTLLRYSDVTNILLLEDDCWPIARGWDIRWCKAADRYNHVNYGPATVWPVSWRISGRGIAEDPWLTKEITGQATITNRAALLKVGYLNPAFRGYGYGHVEWTMRFARHGLIKNYPCIKDGLAMEDLATYKNQDDIVRNKIKIEQLISTYRNTIPNFVWPWENIEQRNELENEVLAGLSANQLVLHNKD